MIKNNKAALNMLSSAFFVILLVILVFIIYFTMFATKMSDYEQKLYFSNVEYANTLLQIYLNRQECLAYSGLNDTQISTQSLIDYKKVIGENNKNRDINCMAYFKGIAYMQIIDYNSNKIFNVSTNYHNPKWAGSVITSISPIALYYSGNDIRLGLAKMTFITGKLPDFYATVKHSSYFKQSARFALNNNIQISYDNNTNIWCFGDDCFKAKFYCNVEGFVIKKGQYIIQLDYKDNNIKVKY